MGKGYENKEFRRYFISDLIVSRGKGVEIVRRRLKNRVKGCKIR